MEPWLAIVIIFFSFIAGAGGFIATLLLYALLNRLNAEWVNRIDTPIPPTIVKRGLLLTSGPMLLAVYSAIRIFFLIKGIDIHLIWSLIVMAYLGIYSLLISAFIYQIFEQVIETLKKTG